MTIAVISMIRDPWGGSEELWYEMAKEARKKGIELIHVGYENPQKHSKLIELEKLGVKHIDRPGWTPAKAGRIKKTIYLAYNFLRKKINSPISRVFRNNPDIVLYNGTCYSIAKEKELLRQIKKSKARFFILGELNFEAIRNINDAEAGVVSEAYDLCKKVFFVSQRNLDVAQRHLCKTIHNAIIVKNPVNLQNLEKIPLPANSNELQLAVVANLVTIHKGQDILFEALSKWENKNWVLNLYGNGYDKTYLQNLAKHLQLEQQIKFHGSVKDIRKVWEQNQLLIMPSIMEGMPLAVVEAMICGRICIAADVGGIGEWITDEKNGFLIGAPTVSLILKTLKNAWSSRNSWPEIAEAAHTTALRLYDPNPGLTLLKYITTE